MRSVRQIAGTFAYVVVTRPTAQLDHTATCGCGWRGTGWTDFEPAAREARNHECDVERQCIGRVTHRVTGTTPATKYQRGCTRNASEGHRTCFQHREADDA